MIDCDVNRHRERKNVNRRIVQMVGLAPKDTSGPRNCPAVSSNGSRWRSSLANDPALILADEPTGNLDTENTKTIYGAFLVAGGETWQDGDHGES